MNPRTAKAVFDKVIETGQDPRSIIEAEGLTQISDTAAIEAIVEERSELHRSDPGGPPTLFEPPRASALFTHRVTSRVLVLGNDTRSFLAVVRSLGRQGLEVHVGWCPKTAAAAKSRYIAKRHEIPLPGPHSDEWKSVFREIWQRERFDLVLPTDDPSLIPLQINRAEFERLGRVYLLNDHAFEVTSSKVKTQTLAESLGVPVPRSLVVQNENDLPAALGQLPLPIVIKPYASFTPDSLFARNDVQRARTRDEASLVANRFLKRGPVLLQENFIGVGGGVEVLANRGEILMSFQHERVHEPLAGGGSSYRKSVRVQPAMLDAAAKIMRALDYTGVAMMETRQNPRTGEWVLIEINGRFWGSLPLAIAAGADFPYALHQLLVEGKTDFDATPRVGIACRNFKSDLKWNWSNLRADRCDPVLATRPLSKVLAETWNTLTLRERSDTFVLDDLKPAFAEIGQLLGGLSQAVGSKMLRGAMRMPLVGNAQNRRAKEALANAKTILFVCFGNICRSPFAELYARTILPPHVKIISCGTFPVPGRTSPEVACEVAKEFGVELSNHRSALLTEEMAAQADVIFVFDQQNRRAVLDQCPSARKKIRLIGSLTGIGHVRDPFGGNQAEFRSVYQQIANLLKP